MKKNNISPGLGGFYVMLAGCLWGTTGLFINRLNTAGLTSMQISVLRAAITAVVMVLLTLCRNPRLLRIRLRDAWCFLGTGVASVLFFNYCYFHTIQESGMAVAATLLYTSPVFVMLLSLWLFREKLTRRKVLCLVLTVLGCVLVSGILTGGGSITGRGMLLGVGAGLGYALYSIFTRFAIQRNYDPMTITTYTFLFATAGGLLLTDFRQLSVAFQGGGWSLGVWLAIYAVVTTVAPYMLYTTGLRGTENSTAAVMAAVEPVCATLLEILFLHRFPSLTATAGILLVLGALVWLNWPAGKIHKQIKGRTG